MKITEPSGGDAPDQSTTLTVRPASFVDTEAFVRLASACALGRAETFDEASARYLFAGLPRLDPAINLLISGEDVIGFALLSRRANQLTGVVTGIEELIFIRPDRHSLDSEMLLHRASELLFEEWAVCERLMQIPASPHAACVAKLLGESSYHPIVAVLRRTDAIEKKPSIRTGLLN